jgi:SAM-dependent methyltransferase
MGTKEVIKSLINVVSCRATDIVFGWRHRRRWQDENGLGGLYQRYFNEYLRRAPIADAVAEVIGNEDMNAPKIIEFGCSGGNNLKLLHERLSTPFRYCGLDIQEAAIEFARRQFPEDTFYKCSDTELSILKPKLGHFDIFLAASVLCYLPQKETQAVLDFAAEIADYLVLCDYIERFDLDSGINDGLFLHPFGLMCQKAGFKIVVPARFPWQKNRNGLFVARAQ